MTYLTIEHQIAIVHANLIDLQFYLSNIPSDEIPPADWDGIRFMLTFLRKHMNKPLYLPRLKNSLPE